MKKLVLVAALLMPLPAWAETIQVGVNGLVCAFCVKGIESSFKKQGATDKVNVDLDKKLVTLEVKKGQSLDDETIRTLITDAGYTTTGIERVK